MKRRKLSHDVNDVDVPTSTRVLRSKESLFRMVQNGELDKVKENRHCFNFKDDRDGNGDTYLHRVVANDESSCSCRCSRCSAVKNMINFILAEAPELASVKNKRGETPLLVACKNAGRLMIIRQLIKANPGVAKIADNAGHTPLHWFVSHKRFIKTCGSDGMYVQYAKTSVVMTIANQLMKNSDVKAKNRFEETPLSILFTSQRRGVYQSELDEKLEGMLIKNGADLHFKDSKHALDYLRNCSVEMYKLIIKFCQSSELNNPNCQGYTTLHRIIMDGRFKNRLDIYKILMAKNACTIGLKHVITLAQEYHCDFPIIEHLIKHYPEFNINTQDRNGATLLMKYGNTIKVIKKLLKLGCDASIVDRHGRNALTITSKENRDCDVKVLWKLIEAGSNPLLRIRDNVFSLLNIMKNDNLKSLSDFLCRLLQSPQFQDKTMPTYLASFYMKLISDLYVFYSSNNIENCVISRILALVVKSNPSVLKMKMKVPYNENSRNTYFVGPIGYVVYKTNIFPYNGHKLIEFLKIMIDAGFPEVSEHRNEVTPLTILLLKPCRSISSECLQTLTTLMIEKIGVFVNSTALCTENNYNIDDEFNVNPEIMRIFTYLIPDALIVSFVHLRSVELVTILLPYFWGPPLELFMLCYPKLINTSLNRQFAYMSFQLWMPFLLQYGGMLTNSHICWAVKYYLRFWKNRAHSTSLQEVASDMENYNQDFIKSTSTPLSLQNMCKYVIRKSVVKTGISFGYDIPALIDRLPLPPPLKRALEHSTDF